MFRKSILPFSINPVLWTCLHLPGSDYMHYEAILVSITEWLTHQINTHQKHQVEVTDHDLWYKMSRVYVEKKKKHPTLHLRQEYCPWRLQDRPGGTQQDGKKHTGPKIGHLNIWTEFGQLQDRPGGTQQDGKKHTEPKTEHLDRIWTITRQTWRNTTGQ